MAFENFPQAETPEKEPDDNAPKNNFRNILTIALVIALLGTWGYIIWDKNKGKEKESTQQNIITSTANQRDELQKELEEATALEMPMMQQNLPIIATITTLGTLMGLLGTVIGMIRSFAALSAGGGADSMALSQGISEALINTAFGILTGALAVISYNYFTAKIDNISYAIDEIGFSIVGVFQSKH